MQRVLSQRAVWQVARVRSLLIGLAAGEPPLAVCCCVPRLPPAFQQCHLSTSISGKAVEKPKHTPPEDEQSKEPNSPSRSHASTQTSPPGEDALSTFSPGASSPTPQKEVEVETDPLQDKSIGLLQRFKKTFKQYGKVMIPVHLLTSSVWVGTFYFAAIKGVNVVPFLEVIGFPDRLVGLLKESQSGYALTTYAMYKIATPARYTVTLGGTSYLVQYLRKHGYFSTPPPVAVKDYLQDKMEETKDKLSEKMEETKDKFSEKMEETKELFSERMEETKGRLSDKMEETKDKFSERLQETKELLSERMEETKDKFSGKMEETKDKFSERLQDTKDKVSFGKKTD